MIGFRILHELLSRPPRLLKKELLSHSTVCSTHIDPTRMYVCGMRCLLRGRRGGSGAGALLTPDGFRLGLVLKMAA